MNVNLKTGGHTSIAHIPSEILYENFQIDITIRGENSALVFSVTVTCLFVNCISHLSANKNIVTVIEVQISVRHRPSYHYWTSSQWWSNVAMSTATLHPSLTRLVAGILIQTHPCVFIPRTFSLVSQMFPLPGFSSGQSYSHETANTSQDELS